MVILLRFCAEKQESGVERLRIGLRSVVPVSRTKSEANGSRPLESEPYTSISIDIIAITMPLSSWKLHGGKSCALCYFAGLVLLKDGAICMSLQTWDKISL